MDYFHSEVVFLFCQSFVTLVLFFCFFFCVVCLFMAFKVVMCVHSRFAITSLRKRGLVSSLIVVLLLYGIVGYRKCSKISNISCLAIRYRQTV